MTGGRQESVRGPASGRPGDPRAAILSPDSSPPPPGPARPGRESMFRSKAGGWWGRGARAAEGEQLAVIPVEVPVITETKRLWLRGDRAAAIRFAYPAALADLQRAYNLRLDSTWTHEEIHTHAMNPEMGHLPEFFRRLYRLYEPVRYGADGPTPTENPVSLLLSIYGHSPMWRLYAETLTRSPFWRGRPLPTNPIPDAARSQA